MKTTQQTPFPADEPQMKTVPITVRLPQALLEKIDLDVAARNKEHPRAPQTRSDRIIYLLGYAYQAGELNQFIDLMKSQYLELLAATPESLSIHPASFQQVEQLNEKVADLEEKLAEILERL